MQNEVTFKKHFWPNTIRLLSLKFHVGFWYRKWQWRGDTLGNFLREVMRQQESYILCHDWPLFRLSFQCKTALSIGHTPRYAIPFIERFLVSFNWFLMEAELSSIWFHFNNTLCKPISIIEWILLLLMNATLCVTSQNNILFLLK